jgi:aromatic-L-amino-acid/L-tryptophan decarboxylase
VAAALLEPGPRELASIERAVSEFVRSFLASRSSAPPIYYDGSELVARLAEPPPRVGIGFDQALARFREGLGSGFELTSPGFMGYVPGGGQVVAAMGALLASVTNPFIAHAHASPTMVAVEDSVIAWLCEEFGLPVGRASGIFTSGGSISALTAIVAARASRLPEDFSHHTIYVSADTHRSATKAARAAGFADAAVRVLPVDSSRRCDVGALRTEIERDLRRGWKPFMVVATAGSTDTGAIDPLADIADVAARHGIWMHVDGCYGGLFHLTDRGRRRMAGIEAADSIAVDPHKAFSIPAGCGCLLVRERDTLRAAFSDSHEHCYLRDTPEDDGMIDYADHSLELTRPFGGLQLWLPLQTFGVEAFRGHLDEKLDLARELADVISDCPQLELPWPVDLSVVAFRPRADRFGGAAEADRAAAEILQTVNRSGRVLISSTEIDARLVLRACILTHRTHRDQVLEAAALIVRAAGLVAASNSRNVPFLAT